MVTIEPFQTEHLSGLHNLVNSHLQLVVNEWSLPRDYIAASLSSNPLQVILDPWVSERVTLCATKDTDLVAAAHLLRYGTDGSVSADYQNAGDIGWFLFSPDAFDTARALLDQCRKQFASWSIDKSYIWDFNLPVPVFLGLPDSWPHIVEFLESMHCKRNPSVNEAIYGGLIPQAVIEQQPPVDGAHILIAEHYPEIQLAAWVNDSPVGHCYYQDDLTLGGVLPSFRNWAALSEIEVSVPWRNKGIGTWLIQSMLSRLAPHRDKVTFSVAQDDELAGAGRFYARFGWGPLARSTKGWILE